jgi:prenylcysteine alpha-carboxyl methylesterase
MADSPLVQRSNTTVGFEYRRTPSFYLHDNLIRSFSSDFVSGASGVPATPSGAFVELLRTLFHEIPVIAPLAGRLIKLLGLGVRAYVMLWRLILFAIALSPAISKAGLWWWRSRSISRSVRYGEKPRNFLDIYHPIEEGAITPLGGRPVVVYVTGGAWIIGYKAWAAPLGEYLSRHGIIMIAVDYRNFPQGTFGDMVEDTGCAINWVIKNVSQFGGDPDNIILVGQSAGAQITASLLVSGKLDTKVKKFVGVSGPYDMVTLAPNFHKLVPFFARFARKWFRFRLSWIHVQNFR